MIELDKITPEIRSKILSTIDHPNFVKLAEMLMDGVERVDIKAQIGFSDVQIGHMIQHINGIISKFYLAAAPAETPNEPTAVVDVNEETKTVTFDNGETAPLVSAEESELDKLNPMVEAAQAPIEGGEGAEEESLKEEASVQVQDVVPADEETLEA